MQNKIKTVIITLVLLTTLGAGCNQQDINTTKTPEKEQISQNNWYITIENDENWYAFAPYSTASQRFNEEPKRSLKAFENKAIIQNTNKPIKLGESYRESLEYYENEDWVALRIMAYPKNATMPSSAKIKKFGDKTVGELESSINNLYYWRGEENLYEILFYAGKDIENPEKLLEYIKEN